MDYGALAGDRAVHAFANAEASRQYARALAATDKLVSAPDPGILASLHVKYAVVLGILAEYEAAAAEYQWALQLCRQVGDRRREMEILAGLSTIYNWYHRPEPAVEYSEQALTIA